MIEQLEAGRRYIEGCAGGNLLTKRKKGEIIDGGGGGFVLSYGGQMQYGI